MMRMAYGMFVCMCVSIYIIKCMGLSLATQGENCGAYWWMSCPRVVISLIFNRKILRTRNYIIPFQQLSTTVTTAAPPKERALWRPTFVTTCFFFSSTCATSLVTCSASQAVRAGRSGLSNASTGEDFLKAIVHPKSRVSKSSGKAGGTGTVEKSTGLKPLKWNPHTCAMKCLDPNKPDRIDLNKHKIIKEAIFFWIGLLRCPDYFAAHSSNNPWPPSSFAPASFLLWPPASLKHTETWWNHDHRIVVWIAAQLARFERPGDHTPGIWRRSDQRHRSRRNQGPKPALRSSPWGPLPLPPAPADFLKLGTSWNQRFQKNRTNGTLLSFLSIQKHPETTKPTTSKIRIAFGSSAKLWTLWPKAICASSTDSIAILHRELREATLVRFAGCWDGPATSTTSALWVTIAQLLRTWVVSVWIFFWMVVDFSVNADTACSSFWSLAWRSQKVKSWTPRLHRTRGTMGDHTADSNLDSKQNI